MWRALARATPTLLRASADRRLPHRPRQRDPELRALPSGTSVCGLRIACNSRRRDADGDYSEKPGYFDVTIYGPAADSVARYVLKGSRVAVDGRLEWREWETADRHKRQAVSIVADTVQFLDSRSGPGAEGDTADGLGGGEDQEPVGAGARGVELTF